MQKKEHHDVLLLEAYLDIFDKEFMNQAEKVELDNMEAIWGNLFSKMTSSSK